MFNGLEHVWQAAEILVGRDSKLKERLCDAVSEFSVALLQPEQWPPEMYETARSYRDRLAARGNFEVTISNMEAADVNRAAIDLLALASDIHQANVDYFKQNRPKSVGERVATAFVQEMKRDQR
jgi:hypothetical protein